MTNVLPVVGGGMLRDRAAATLEERILDGTWAPGDRLPTEFELGEQLGVSRAVVRDSLRSLAARGLVEIRQGVGTTVATNSDGAYVDAITLRLLRSGTTIWEIAQARATIECMAAGVAAERRTDADLTQMSRHLADYATAVQARDWTTAMAQHLRWHLSILDATHMPVLSMLLGPMQRLILESAVPARIDNPRDYELDEERAIFNAIAERDRTGAEEAMRAHFAFMDNERYRARLRKRFRKPVSIPDQGDGGRKSS